MLKRLFVALQRVLPARALSRLVYRLARNEHRWIARPLIYAFMRLYGIDLTEAERSTPREYASFNDFFTRRLKPGTRPFNDDPRDIGCPADGYLQRHGQLTRGRLIQAKGLDYSADQLLACPGDELARFSCGSFATIYLAPHNYHRVHMPLAAKTESVRLIPGRLFSVNRTTADAIPDLFARNERVVLRCSAGDMPFWLVFVGAMNVACMSTCWHGELRTDSDFALPSDSHLGKGAYVGHFNLGSTVVLLFPENAVDWSRQLEPGQSLRVGQSLGRLRAPG